MFKLAKSHIRSKFSNSHKVHIHAIAKRAKAGDKQTKRLFGLDGKSCNSRCLMRMECFKLKGKFMVSVGPAFCFHNSHGSGSLSLSLSDKFTDM